MEQQAKSEAKRYEPDEIVDDVLLTMIDGIGPRTEQRLRERFGGATEILSASKDELQQIKGISGSIADKIVHARSFNDVRSLIDVCRREEIQIVARGDVRYPERLEEIVDPPSILYVQGTLEPIDALAVSIVGTRRISPYGERMTRKLSLGLAEAGFTIVSGLALGIDGAAHKAALDAGGRTIAVLGGGILKLFPAEHRELANRVVKSGAIISEFPPEYPPLSGNFPRRNRVVSGLSLGVLVVESPLKSGSLITARLATEQNRDVFAVPGAADQENSRGCHRLIRDGATLVETVGDILDVLGPFPQPIPQPIPHPKRPAEKIRRPAELKLNERERAVLQWIETSPTPIDVVIAKTNLAPRQVVGTISALEFRKIVARGEANTVRRI